MSSHFALLREAPFRWCVKKNRCPSFVRPSVRSFADLVIFAGGIWGVDTCSVALVFWHIDFQGSRKNRLLPPIQFLSFCTSVDGQTAQLSNIELRSDQFCCSKTFTEGVQCTTKFADNPVTRSRIPTSQKIRSVFLLHTVEKIPSLFEGVYRSKAPQTKLPIRLCAL